MTDISNPAKLLRKVMQITGIGCAKTLAADLGIPLRTIQRLRLEIADATCANDAISGGATHATSAINGVETSTDKKEIPPTPPKEKTTLPRTTVEQASHRTREPEDELLAGLNGSTAIIVRDVAQWANMPEANSRKWLATTVSVFGTEVTKRAYQKLQTDLATGMIIADPLRTMSTIANRLKSEGVGKPKAAFKPSRW
jgi:hypothetical protein